MIALDHDRPGLGFLRVERAAGDSRELRIVVNLLAVERGRDAVADDGDLNGLPFSGRLARVHHRRLGRVDGHVAVLPILGAAGIVEHLHLVAAAQIDAAVALGRQLVLRVEPEVLELLLGDQVVAVGLVGHGAVDHRPHHRLVLVLDAPRIHRLAVEQHDRLAEGVLRVGVAGAPDRRTLAGDLGRPDRATHGLARSVKCDRWPVLRGSADPERQLVAAQLHVLRRDRTAAAVQEHDDGLAAFVFDVEPVDAGGGRFRRDVPGSGERVALRAHWRRNRERCHGKNPMVDNRMS